MDPPDMVINFHIQLLERELEHCGAHVLKNFSDFTRQKILSFFTNKIFIFHIHFPDWALKNNWSQTLSSTFVLLGKLLYLKLLGIKIVRTIHDFGPLHALNINLKFNCLFQKLIYFLCDYCIFLSPSSKKEYFDLFSVKNTANDKCAIIPLSTYESYYPNQVDKNLARDKLNLDRENFVFLLFGLIRSYKGFTETAHLFHKLKNDKTNLVIAGRLKANEVNEKELLNLLKNDQRIIYHQKLIPADEVQYYFKAADALVLPYNNKFCCGSGLLMLAFDFGLPVIARNTPYIMDALSAEKNTTFETDDDLFRLMKNIEAIDFEKIKAYMQCEKNKYSPQLIAKKHYHEVYLKL